MTSIVDDTSSNRVGNENSIAIDSNNKVHISYADKANADLKHATNVLQSTFPAPANRRAMPQVMMGLQAGVAWADPRFTDNRSQ